MSRGKGRQHLGSMARMAMVAMATGVAAAADVPPVASPQTITAYEDQVAAITLAGSDADGDPLIYRIATAPGGGILYADAAATIPVATGAVLASPVVYFRSATDANGAGIGTFAFTVDDGLLVSAPATVAVDVVAVNDPPRIDTLPDLTVNEDVASPIVITLSGLAPGPATATDEGGQRVNVYPLVDSFLSGVVQALTFDPVPGTIELHIDVERDSWGIGRIYLVAVDDGGNAAGGNDSAVTSFQMIVMPQPDPPLVVADDPVPITGADTIITMPVTADPDGGAAGLRIAALPAHGTLVYDGAPVAVGDVVHVTANGLHYLRTDAGPADDRFAVMLVDQGGAFPDQGPVGVDLVMPGPFQPVIATTWLGTLQDLPCTATLVASDADSATLAWEVVEQPQGARIDLLDAASGLVRITPEAGWTGESTCAVMVGDGVTDPVPAAIAVRVTGLDAPRPHIAGEAPLLVEAGSDLDLTVPVAFDDLGGSGSLSCALAGGPPPGLAASAEGAAAVRLRWTVPADAAAGTWYDVQVLLLDGDSRTVGVWPLRLGVRTRPQGVN